MLGKTVMPKTKAELIRALQAASFRSFEIYEGDSLRVIPSSDRLRKSRSTAIIMSR